ncbi:hypothetical protein OAT84_01900 [Gammaproteobacteria bacterium]|nr:hypothetical protein [Gammaproteobacteria bacterium]
MNNRFLNKFTPISLPISPIDSQGMLHVSELIGHELVYKLAKNKLSVKHGVLMTDQTGKEGEFTITKINTGHSALHGYIFLPKDPSNMNIHISWTGTINLEGVLTDMQISPGEDSYRKREVAIIDIINRTISSHRYNVYKKSDCYPKFNIHFYGHSLGGSLCQLTFHSIQRAILQNSISDINDELWMHCNKINTQEGYWNTNASPTHHSKSGFRCKSIDHLNAITISSLNIALLNSAGVINSVARTSTLYSELLSKLGIKIHGHFGYISEDAIQTSGQSTVLIDCKKEQAHTAVMKVGKTTGYSTKMGIFVATTTLSVVTLPLHITALIMSTQVAQNMYSTISAHKRKIYKKESYGKNAIEIYDNSNTTDAKRVNHTLKNKSTFLQIIASIRNQIFATTTPQQQPTLAEQISVKYSTDDDYIIVTYDSDASNMQSPAKPN